MKLLGIVYALGRLVLPRRAADPGTPLPGEIWQVEDSLFYRNNADDDTIRLLDDLDMGVANGVATLGVDGIVPAAQLPSTLTSAFILPIGGGFDFYGDPSNIPNGCLVADGAEYLRTEYPALFAAVRCKYGRPSTDEYFRVPDRISRVGYGAWASPNSGMVRRVDVVNRGQGYTAGTYTFTFTGGSFSVAATGTVVIVNENVPGVGVTGVIDHVSITLPGTYTSLGAATTGTAANCALTIPGAAIPGGTGFTYDIFAQPTAGVRAPYGWSVRMTNHGTGYTTPPSVTFTGGALAGATAYAIVRDGGVAEVVVTSPGYGSTTSVTVVFTGGGGSAAAGTINTELAYLLPGDYVGSESHLPLLEEMVGHHHSLVTNNDDGDDDGGPRRNNAGVNTSSVNTNNTGGDYPLAMHPAGVGAIPLIRAS